MLGISILDTIVLYTLAAIGVSVVVNKFYHSMELSFFLMTENVKYYFPRVYDTLYDLTTKLNLTKKQETKVPQEKNKEQEVMDDILSKTKGYYDSIKTIFESKIKDIPDPQLRNKIDQWYQTTTRFVETPEHSPSSLQDLKKRLSECSDEIFQLLENYH